MDSTHAGWLGGDDYQWRASHNADAAPGAVGPPGSTSGPALPAGVLAGRHEDEVPPCLSDETVSRAARAARVAADMVSARRAADEERRAFVVRDRMSAFAAYVDEVTSWHRPFTSGTGEPMCSCSIRGDRCRYLRAAYEYLRQPLPWPLADESAGQP